MGQFHTIKKDARRLLKGHRMQGCLVAALVMVSGFLGGVLETVLRTASKVPAFFEPPAPLLSLRNASVHSVLISMLTFLLTFLLVSIVRQGACRWSVLLSQEKTPKLSEVFFFFEKPHRWGKAIGLRLAVWWRMTGYALLLALPPAVLLWIMYAVYTPTFRAEYLGRMEVFIWMIIALWSLLAMLLFAAAAMRYLPAPYLLADSPAQSIRKILRKSRRMMIGEKGNTLLLLFSFSIWFLPLALAAIALMVSFVWDFNWYGMGLLEIAGLLSAIQFFLWLWQSPCFWICCERLVETLQAREPEPVDCKTREYLYHAQLDELLMQDGFCLDYKLNIPQNDVPPDDETGKEQLRGWPAADGGVG